MFDVDISTGVLTYDDATYPAVPKMVNDDELMISGWGDFYESNSTAYVDDSPFTQPSRTMHIKATVTLRDNTVINLGDADCVRFQSASDTGPMFLFGANPVATYSLALANADRRWDAGSSLLGSRSLDGADVMVELGAEDANETPQYVAMGRFLVDAVDNQSYNTVVTISGCDYMGNKMMTEFVDISSYPPGRTKSDVALLACSLAGVSCDVSALAYTDGEIVKPTFSSKVTCRDVVGWIAQMSQGAVYIDGAGVLRFFSHFFHTPTYIYPAQYMTITTSLPFYGYNYRLLATTYGGATTYDVTYEPIPGAPFYLFSITLSPFMPIDANIVTRLTEEYIESAGLLISVLTSGYVAWRGGGFIAPTSQILVAKTSGETITFKAMQNRVSFDGSLTCETGYDANSLTKNITEGK